MKILEKYLIKESFKPFFGALGVFTSLFLIDLIIGKLSLIIEKKLTFMTVVSLFGHSIPAMVALTIPMAILFASIMTFGKLSIDNELTAIKSCGISIYRLFLPLYIIVIFLSAGMLYFNHVVLPNSNFRSRDLLIHIAYRNPITNIKSGVFNKNKNISDIVIYAKDRTDKLLTNIIIYNKSQKDILQIISAKSGTILLENNGNDMIAKLYDGEIHEIDKKNPKIYRLVTFENFNFNLMGGTTSSNLTHERSDRELTTKAMLVKIRDNQKKMDLIDLQLEKLNLQKEQSKSSSLQSDLEKRIKKQKNTSLNLKKINFAYLVETHKKNALAFACIIFLFIGIPVGLMTKSSGIGAAFSFSAVVFIVYHALLIGGEEVADRGFVLPWITMWFPNFFLVLIGIFLTWKSRRDTNAFDSINFKVRTFLKKINFLLSKEEPDEDIR